jgi:LPS export ABC transporter permease LptG
MVVVRIPRLNLPRPGLLDLYVGRQYLRVFVLGLVGLLGIFYISTFMDLADKLFKGSATSAMLLRYFYYQTPQFVYYVIPMAALVSTLVTVGLMTKNSEIVVVKACGVSLYRMAVPLFLFAVAASGALFGLQEQVLAYSNREADRLNRLIRGIPLQSQGPLGRRWIFGQNGDIYHYELFDARSNEFTQLATYRLQPRAWGLESITRAARVRLVKEPQADGELSATWRATQGWTRGFAQTTGANRGRGRQDLVTYEVFGERDLTLEPPSYFKGAEPDPEQMTFGQLQEYIHLLRSGGYNAVRHMVALQRKVAFPFVTVVMTLLAVPFGVTTGRRGALYGIGIGIVLAILYWTMMSVFAAMGAGGLLSPVLAAWAPNILAASVAIFLLLTVRT